MIYISSSCLIFTPVFQGSTRGNKIISPQLCLYGYSYPGSKHILCNKTYKHQFKLMCGIVGCLKCTRRLKEDNQQNMMYMPQYHHKKNTDR